MKFENLKTRSFQLIFASFLALCFMAGNNVSAYADPKGGNPPGPEGGPGAGPEYRQHAKEQWKAMSPEKRYEYGSRRLEHLKVKRAKMVAKDASPDALKAIDKRIKHWETWINQYNEKVKK